MTSGDRSLLLCRPRGGLNDLLCSIERCWSYAERTGRVVLIDALGSGLHDDFWNYFRPTTHYESGVQFVVDYKKLDTLPCIPHSIQGRVSRFFADYSYHLGVYTDNLSDDPVTFDTGIIYEAPLIVHEQGWQILEYQAGCALGSLVCLARLRFTKNVAHHIENRLESMPAPYIGIHIRNSDYTTDYQAFLSEIASTLKDRNVLVCTDNFSVFEYAKEVLQNSNVFRLSNFGDNGGKPLHGCYSGLGQYTRNLEVLTDLVALANAERIYFSNVREVGRPSGFSLLAFSLWNNRKVVCQLMM